MISSNRLSKLAVAMCAALPALVSASQTTTVQGLHDNSSSYVALQNATIVTEPGQTIEMQLWSFAMARLNVSTKTIERLKARE